MKKLLLILLCLPLFFSSCEEENSPSAYIGTWSGSIEDSVETPITMHVDIEGYFNAMVAVTGYSVNLDGHVDEDGYISSNTTEIIMYNGNDSIDYRITLDGKLYTSTGYGTYDLANIADGSDYTYHNWTMEKQ